MGWLRNYHCYEFFYRANGAVWGPDDSNAIDMMHLPMKGSILLDDRKTRLAEILQVSPFFLCFLCTYQSIKLLDLVSSPESSLV